MSLNLVTVELYSIPFLPHSPGSPFQVLCLGGSHVIVIVIIMLAVYDNVLAPSTSKYLHAACSLGELGDELHTAFDRSRPPATALESCLHSILSALGDESACVEYWWRDSWEHVEAHEDVDEYLFENSGARRHPTNAHVLYLTVGPAVLGPTCVWSEASAEELPMVARRDFGALTTVPACTGRLLRFDGPLMHAVPRPTLRWLPPTARGGGARAASGTKPTKDDLVRSVVLFNTWDEPPLDVPLAEDPDDPAAIIRDLAASFSSPKIEALVDLMATPDTECRPYDEWSNVEPIRRAALPASDADAPSMKVSLLGEVERRGQEEQVLEMPAPDGLVEGLMADRVVTSFV